MVQHGTGVGILHPLLPTQDKSHLAEVDTKFRKSQLFQKKAGCRQVPLPPPPCPNSCPGHHLG